MSEKWKYSRQLAVIGIGEHPSNMFAEKAPVELGLYAIKQALEDAGISKDDLDAILVHVILADRFFNTDIAWARMVEELGIGGKCKTNYMVHSGGSSASNMLQTALGLVATGSAETILIMHVEKLGTGLPSEGVRDIFATHGISEEWEFLYGYNYNGIGGLLTNRFMHETGTTIEEIASVIVSLRKWAALNPNALLRRPLTVEDVLSSKVVATPQTSRMCNIVCDGASAIIVTTAEKAKKITKTPVYLLGMGSLVTHYSLMSVPDMTRLGWQQAADEAYQKAGVGPEDIDIAEIYDSYPILPLIQLEAFGFCDRGKAGRFVYEGNTLPGGRLPMTTNGGMLCQGHLGAGGGTAVLVEAIRQLQGKAGERQVENANTALVSEVGGQYMDAHVVILGR